MSVTILLAVALVVLPSQRGGSSNSEESILKTARLQTTDEALLDFFRKRTLPTPPQPVIEKLAQSLASRDATQADAAQAELICLGVAVVPVVREVANYINDVQTWTRAKQILELLEGSQAADLPLEAARLLAARKPAGAAEVLLGYLPFADNDQVFQELESALVDVSIRQGKPEPALLAALKDPRAVRRAIAAQVLCRVSGAAVSKDVRPLLNDPEPIVRLKAAQGLANADDSEAITALIRMLADTSSLLSTQAEEYLTQLAGEWAVKSPHGQDLLSRQLRLAVWAAWWQEIDGEKLLTELKSRTLTDQELEKAQALLHKLEEENPEAREAAVQELAALGLRVSSLLRRAIQQGHSNLSAASARCLNSIVCDVPPSPLPRAALRLLRLRRPEGTVAALLAFLPCAEDEEMVNQIREVLIRTGVVDGKPDEALVKALNDKIGIRRAEAASVLCRNRVVDHRSAVRQLLADKDLEVRRQVALELASSGDKEAVPTLIALLEELPGDRTWEVETYLEKLTRDKVPSEISKIMSDRAGRKKAAGIWRAWWEANKSKVVMVDAADSTMAGKILGYTLLVQDNFPGRGSETVMELGPDNKPRWTLTGLNDPRNAQMLSDQRVLVVEANRVTERDLRGKILWQTQVSNNNSAWSAQRLRNGNTFIVSLGIGLIEVDGAGKEVLNIAIPGIEAARRLPDGEIVGYGRNQLVQFDRKGRKLKRIQLSMPNSPLSEVLDNGHVLIPSGDNLIELDGSGKEIHRFNMPGVFHGFRLPNGHTLVSNRSKYVELNADWRLIKETTLETRPYRVKGR